MNELNESGPGTKIPLIFRLHDLKKIIEAKHWTWRSECNTPTQALQYAHGNQYTFRIYAGPYARIADGGSELEAAERAWEKICEVGDSVEEGNELLFEQPEEI